MVQTCCDSDRLDLGRVGIRPHSAYLCMAAAKQPELSNWCNGQAQLHFVPGLVRDEWGISLR